MYGIFMESLVILKNYGGRAAYLALCTAAFVFLFVREKVKWKRYLVLYVPLFILAMFLFPLTRKVYVALMDEGVTYYRILWLVPFGITVPYALVMLLSGRDGGTAKGEADGTGTAAAGKTVFRRAAGLVMAVVLVALCGSPVYRSVYISRAQNLYHLPQIAADLCDAVLADAGEDGKVHAAFPAELVHYIRQYDTRIIMPFGREMVEQAWNHWNLVYSAMEEPEVIDMHVLTDELRNAGCDHLVLRTGRKTDAAPETCGWEEMAVCGDFRVYVDRKGADNE